MCDYITHKTYYDNGITFKEYLYDIKKSGENSEGNSKKKYKEYFANGKLKREVNFVDGVRHGYTYTYYYDTGNVSSKTLYENGSIIYHCDLRTIVKQ